MKFIMNHTLVRPLQNVFTAATLAVAFAAANAAETPVSWEEAGERAQAIVKKMSFEDKVKFTGGGTVRVAGGSGAGGYNWCGTLAMPQYGLPGIAMADASAGIRIRDGKIKDVPKGGDYPETLKATSFPSLISLAATWDPEAAKDYSAALAQEARSKGVNILLGPSINIQRQAQNGRSFEYLGEDPYLAGKMVAPYVSSLQANGVIATAKHFAANQTEWFRQQSNTIVDERTLWEIYFPAFEAAIHEGGGLAIMTSYNLVNGEWPGQNKWLLTDMLRNKMNFKGLIMTDWKSVYTPDLIIDSGMDMVMPDNSMIMDAFKKGDITEATFGAQIDRMVFEFLRPCIAMGFLDRKPNEKVTVDWTAHNALVRRIGAEGAILLKNEGNLLPLDPDTTGTVLVTGPNAVGTPTGGGGSGSVPGWNQIDILSGLKHAYGEDKVMYFADPSDEEIEAANVVIVCAGFNGEFDSEGVDRPYELPAVQNTLIEKCFASNPRTVVLLSGGSGMAMPWKDKIPAILHTLYLGQAVGDAVADVLSGKVNPSGHLPFTIQKKIDDFPAKKGSTLDGLNYLVTDGVPDRGATKKQFSKTVFKEGKTAHGKEIYDIPYSEGVFVGYRWYDEKDIAVEFPFGHGLSYTTFAYSDLKLSAPAISGDQTLTVSITVKNTGTRAGAEVVQLYLGDVKASVPRPPRELKGFARVMLKPGESAVVPLTLHKRDLSFWDPESKDWKAEPGKFTVAVGSSSRDLRLKGEFDYR